MIKLIVSGKGEGKTKKLIEMANVSASSSDGHVVFIDDDNRHIYDLTHDVRFVETSGFPLTNYREFIGFVCGVLSQDNDITEIYVDGISNVVRDIDGDALLKLRKKLDSLTDSHGVNFVMSINGDKGELPEGLRELVVE